jgi:hypothetical protein
MFGLKHIIAALAFLIWVSPLLAHRLPEALTTIERNSNTDTIEIIHRLHLHDAEMALSDKFPDVDLSLDSVTGRAQLALYVETQFQIVDLATREPLKLKLIGAELDGDSVLVYQEFKGALPDNLTIRQDALRENFPNQVNTINISLGSQIRTLIFKDKDSWKTLTR